MSLCSCGQTRRSTILPPPEGPFLRLNLPVASTLIHDRHVVAETEPGIGIADIDVATHHPLLGHEDVVEVEALLGSAPMEVRGT